ncbi:hypothetical protein [Pseudochelatococcus sp. G4_1912]|uniref:hypothetical protein n=1 Tax=Pseudochelatococcus sp. G4_1912 TaxID=3114288 RepID=UPI0039C63A98
MSVASLHSTTAPNFNAFQPHTPPENKLGISELISNVKSGRFANGSAQEIVIAVASTPHLTSDQAEGWFTAKSINWLIDAMSNIRNGDTFSAKVCLLLARFFDSFSSESTINIADHLGVDALTASQFLNRADSMLSVDGTYPYSYSLLEDYTTPSVPSLDINDNTTFAEMCDHYENLQEYIINVNEKLDELLMPAMDIVKIQAKEAFQERISSFFDAKDIFDPSSSSQLEHQQLVEKLKYYESECVLFKSFFDHLQEGLT